MKKVDLTQSLKYECIPIPLRRSFFENGWAISLQYGMVFMDKVPYEVLDHAITNAIQARDEVITRNKENQHQHLVLHFRSIVR
ncbi:unnamed protein product [Rhizophagus irregularis]|nr:unnamed protein product [Rhizophagus irregularis]